MSSNDFTKGSVPKTLLGFFFPMLFTNLLQQVYSFVDMVIIGKCIGDNALAAVGNFTTIAFFITGFVSGTANGFSVNISHAYGEKDVPALRKVIASSIKLSAVFALVFTIIGSVSLNPVLSIIKTDRSILDDCLSYGAVIFGGLSVTVSFNLASSVLRAAGDSKTPFLAISISSVTNIVLDLATIYVFHLGVAGPAYATILSQFLSVLVCCIKLSKMEELRPQKKDFVKDWQLCAELLKNGVPMACMNSITSIGCIFVQGCVNAYGVVYTSAYSACNKYLNLFMLPGITAGFSISAFSGQNFGARQYARIRSGVRTACAIALFSALLSGIILYLFSFQLAGLMLSGNEAVGYTASFLKFLAVTLFLLNLLFVFRNCVQGLGKPLIPMCSGILEMLIRILAICLGLPICGFMAAAYAEGLAWAGALLLNVAVYGYFFNSQS